MNDGIERKQVRPIPNPKNQSFRNGEINEKEIKDREKLRRAGQQIATKLTSQRNVTFKVSKKMISYSQNPQPKHFHFFFLRDHILSRDQAC